MSEWLSSFLVVAGVAMVLYIVFVSISKPLAKLECTCERIEKAIGILNEYLQEKDKKDEAT